MKLSEETKIILLIVFGLVLSVGGILHTCSGQAECEASGGRYMREPGLGAFECIHER